MNRKMEELNKKHREDGFRVPENYFNEFEESVISGLYEKEEIKYTPLRWYRNTVLQIAASLILLIGLYVVFSPDKVIPDTQISFENIDRSELSDFENNIELNEEEFAEIIPASLIDSLYDVNFIETGNLLEENAIDELEEEFDPLFDEETEINI